MNGLSGLNYLNELISCKSHLENIGAVYGDLISDRHRTIREERAARPSERTHDA